MRTFATLISCLLTTVPALADAPVSAPAPVRAPAPPRTPSVNLAPIVLADLPEPCRPLAKQASAPVLAQALAARISLAGCVADKSLAALQLLDTGESILAAEHAIARSLELLDEVTKAGDIASELVAEHAKGELYTSMRVRMLNTIPPPDGSETSIALRDSRKQLLESQLEPWQDTARTAFERVVAIAKARPKLLENPVVKTAVRTSEQRLVPLVAMRATRSTEKSTEDAGEVAE